jgi:uncharacterized protein (DUF433 family)
LFPVYLSHGTINKQAHTDTPFTAGSDSLLPPQVGRAVVLVIDCLAKELPMKHEDVVVHRDPDILGGTPVFVGTRVPVKALLDYIEGGHTLDDFLDDFPTVTRAQAMTVLEQGIKLLVDSHARAA